MPGGPPSKELLLSAGALREPGFARRRAASYLSGFEGRLVVAGPRAPSAVEHPIR